MEALPTLGSWYVSFVLLSSIWTHGLFIYSLSAEVRELTVSCANSVRSPEEYENAHTRAWSEIVARADAFVFVTPEYNYGAPPSLINALDYLHQEWAYKPVGFVSYGGVSAGTRSVQMTKQIVTSLRMMPLPEAVSIPFFYEHIDQEARVFNPGETQETAAGAMLNELLRWSVALKPLREGETEKAA
jgi:NAD(P)H-dependent FMN reductase